MNLLQDAARKTADILGRQSSFIDHLRPLYESILDWTSFGKGIPWAINGVTYRVDSHYRHQLGGNYDAPVAAFIAKHTKPGAVCIDVGANIGIYVLQFAHWTRPSGRIIAFEPNPGARAILHRHIQLNDLTERVVVAPVAVGEAPGEAVLYAADADGMSRLGAPNKAIEDRVREIRVPVVNLDGYCEAHNVTPDWLLIDIEGFEIAALSGARRVINAHRGHLNIIVEMHPDVWDSAHTNRAAAEALLQELQLTAKPLTGQQDAFAEHGIVALTPA
jgi:FkbM family methyltransferase